MEQELIDLVFRYWRDKSTHLADCILALRRVEELLILTCAGRADFFKQVSKEVFEEKLKKHPYRER